MTTFEDGSYLTDDGLWWVSAGPCVEGCAPAMIVNAGWHEGFCEVTVYALNEDGESWATDVMVTTALQHEGEPIGLPDESGWNPAFKIVGSLNFMERLVVWFTPVNGRDEPWRMRLKGLTV